MIKSVILPLMITFGLVSQAAALDLFSTTETCTPTTQVVDVSMLNDSTNLSFKLLETSAALLSLSESMLNNASMANSEYVQAMLQLSTDIGTMVDRIGEMADRIVETEYEIGYMADRIVTTQELQNSNVVATQANIVQAQANFLAVLAQK